MRLGTFGKATFLMSSICPVIEFVMLINWVSLAYTVVIP